MDKLTDADKDHEDRRPGDRTRNPVKPGNPLDPDRRGRVRRIGIRIARGYLRHTNAPLSRWPRMRSTRAQKRGVVILTSVRGRGMYPPARSTKRPAHEPHPRKNLDRRHAPGSQN